MKWTIQPMPERWSERVRSGFLLFPKTLPLPGSAIRQTRWLEMASWKEVYYDYWTPYQWEELSKEPPHE